VIPTGSYQTETSETGGVVARTSGRTTILEADGWSVLIALSIPLVASLSAVLPWPAKARRAADVASAAIVTVFSALASLSVGPFFYPTVLALVTIALWPRVRRPAT
jgi:hypothetical protein